MHVRIWLYVLPQMPMSDVHSRTHASGLIRCRKLPSKDWWIHWVGSSQCNCLENWCPAEGRCSWDRLGVSRCKNSLEWEKGPDRKAERAIHKKLLASVSDHQLSRSVVRKYAQWPSLQLLRAARMGHKFIFVAQVADLQRFNPDEEKKTFQRVHTGWGHCSRNVEWQESRESYEVYAALKETFFIPNLTEESRYQYYM